MKTEISIKEAIEMLKEIIDKNLKFSNKEEAIKFLKEKGYEIEEQIKEPERFLKVKFSDRKDVFIEGEFENGLVETWVNVEEDLNDFNYFKAKDYGQFWINGNIQKFEFYYKGKWLECNETMDVRFLR